MLVVTKEGFQVWVFLLLTATVISPLSNRCHAFKETGNFDFVQPITLVYLSENDLIKVSFKFNLLYKN